MPEEYLNNTSQQRARRAFEALIAGEDAAIDLAQAAFLIASEEYLDLDIAHYMTRLDALAYRVRSILSLPQDDLFSPLLPETDLLEAITAINQVLFNEEHFSGNREDYYDPRNSFLNDVLDRHTGIPIALSLLYMEVGKRVGVQIDGIGLPFHFIVGCRVPGGRVYIDPYEGGKILSEQDCRERVTRMLKGKGSSYAHWLEPVSPRQLLVRMLNNLKNIYLHSEDYVRALSVCDRIVLLVPHAPLERRDRGIIHLQLKHYGRALLDLATYVEHAPHAEDREEIRKQIRTIRQIMAMMN